MNRRVLTVASFREAAAPNRTLAYWRSRPVPERLDAVEFLRRQIVEPGTRLRRVLRVIDRARR